MKRRNNTGILALCGILTALAVALMFLGGTIPFASIACPVLASLVLLPVYAECGAKWGLIWYAAVTVLSLLIAPEKESAILFAFFGYYPMLKKFFGHCRRKPLAWLCKLLYLNLAVCAAYALMLFVFRIGTVVADFREAERWMLAAMLVLANVTFVLYDILLDRLEVFYHVRLRPKLKL